MKIDILKSSIRVMIVLMIFTGVSFAHGARYKIINGGIGIEARYSDDTPMSDSDVNVFSADNLEETYVTGITDQNGRFLFLPDKSGEWILKVSDGMGHGVEAKIELDKDFKITGSTSDEHSHLSHIQIIIMAICVMWGFIGTALYFKKR